ncbi:MAG TPA: hypothetical protein VHR66_04015 [Gemmataceae bacterium]|jgi:hypothetical protein|nr:hypothetical protein [Gemmataceae bacterium]
MLRNPLALALMVSLAAGLAPADDRPAAPMAAQSKPLSNEAREELCSLATKVAHKTRAGFPRVALTIEQGRYYADVHPKMTWQAEFGDWFVYSVAGPKGGPDRWSGVVFVQKGTNLIAYYRETW